MKNRERQRANRKLKDTYYERRGRKAEGYWDPTAAQAVRNAARKSESRCFRVAQ